MGFERLNGPGIVVVGPLGKGVDLEALLHGHAKKLNGIDAYFHLDMAVLEEMMGDQGAEIVKGRFMELLDKNLTASEKLADAIGKLLDGDGMKWLRTPVKHELQCAREMVERMLASEVILRSDGQATPWLTSVLKSLERFICFDPLAKNGGSGSASSAAPAVTRGYDALMKRFEEVAKMKERSMDALLPFTCWRHLLSSEQSETVSQWRLDLLKEGAAVPVAQKAESRKPPKKNKKSVAGADEVDAAALALLGLRAA